MAEEDTWLAAMEFEMQAERKLKLAIEEAVSAKLKRIALQMAQGMGNPATLRAEHLYMVGTSKRSGDLARSILRSDFRARLLGF